MLSEWLNILVIPGYAEGVNPESRNNVSICGWIPGPLASLASRNDN
jgi:hypothetical protein